MAEKSGGTIDRVTGESGLVIAGRDCISTTHAVKAARLQKRLMEGKVEGTRKRKTNKILDRRGARMDKEDIVECSRSTVINVLATNKCRYPFRTCYTV